MTKNTWKIKLPEDADSPVQRPPRFYEFWYEQKLEYQQTETARDYVGRMMASSQSQKFIDGGFAFVCQGDISLRFKVEYLEGDCCILEYKGHQKNNEEELKRRCPKIGYAPESHDLRGALKRYLEGGILARYGIVNTQDPGKIAWGAVRNKFDLVVLEYSFGIGGRPTEKHISHIRRKKAIDKLPIIVFSERLTPQLLNRKEDCMLAGANHFINGPIEDIEEIVASSLNGKQNLQVHGVEPIFI